MTARKNGCYNQPRPTAGMPLTVQAGWFDSMYADTRYPKMVTVPFVMQADCQYTKTTPDKACEGCCHQVLPSALIKS